jgi:hypothetical protein
MKKNRVLSLFFLIIPVLLAVSGPEMLAAANADESSFQKSPSCAASTVCGDLPAYIKNLGREPDPSATTEQLHSCGREALPLLVYELRIVDPEIVNAEWWHVAWVERALRSITGQYFQFASNEKLGSVKEYRLQSQKMGFVMEWMSHGRVYIAPRDVQAKVIQAWHNWLKDNGNSFPVKNFEPYGEWFF